MCPLAALAITLVKERFTHSGIVGQTTFGTPTVLSPAVLRFDPGCSGFCPFWALELEGQYNPLISRSVASKHHVDRVKSVLLRIVRDHGHQFGRGLGTLSILTLNRPVADALTYWLSGPMEPGFPDEAYPTEGRTLHQALHAAARHMGYRSQEVAEDMPFELHQLKILAERTPWIFQMVIGVNTHINATGSTSDVTLWDFPIRHDSKKAIKLKSILVALTRAHNVLPSCSWTLGNAFDILPPGLPPSFASFSTWDGIPRSMLMTISPWCATTLAPTCYGRISTSCRCNFETSFRSCERHNQRQLCTRCSVTRWQDLMI
jgi:hypothetical protein